MKTFKISSKCHIKTCRSLKRGLFWRSLVPLFRRIYAITVGFKMQLLRKSALLCYEKTNLNFPQNMLKGATIHFLTIWYLMDHLLQTSVLFNTRQWNVNWVDCKHTKMVRSSQAFISIIYCTGSSSKTQFFSVSIVRILALA